MKNAEKNAEETLSSALLNRDLGVPENSALMLTLIVVDVYGRGWFLADPYWPSALETECTIVT